MSDIAVVYTLVCPGGTIVFNDKEIPSADDFYFLTNLKGLNGAPRRTPQDDQPQGHGGIPHNWWRGARHIPVEGEYVVQSTRIENEIQIIRNELDAALFTAVESITTAAPGTLTWTPAGLTERSLTVLYEVPLEDDGIEQKTFSFGLYAANPDWT